MNTPDLQQSTRRIVEDLDGNPARTARLLSDATRTVYELLRNRNRAHLPRLGTLMLDDATVPDAEHLALDTAPAGAASDRREDSFYERVLLPIPSDEDWKSSTEEVEPVDSVGQSFDLWKANQQLFDETQAEDFWSRLWESVSDQLLSDEFIHFPELGTFQVLDRGNETDDLSIQFVPSMNLKKKRGMDAPIQFEPLNSVRETLREQHRKNVLLLVPEGDLFFEMMGPSFEEGGYSVTFRHDATDALEELRDDELAPSTVLVDSRLEHAQTFLRSFKGDRSNADTPVILMFSEDVDPSRPEQLTVYGDEIIQEPFDVNELLSLIDELHTELDDDPPQHVHFRFPTRSQTVEDAQDFLENLFEDLNLTDETLVEIRAAFREAMGNAAQHGNRYRRDKKILCDYTVRENEMTFRVEDEGRGFDHQKYVSRGESEDVLDQTREGHQEGKYGGFGILLMLRTMDNLSYNEKGNVVELTKELTSDGSDSS